MIYRLYYEKIEDDFVELEQNVFQKIRLACITSEFQKISTTPLEVHTSDEWGGMTFPDFWYDDAVPLFSENVFKSMKQAGVDNLFEKEVIVSDELQGISQKYILGLPPRIHVFDSNGKFDENKVGNYLIFKVSDSVDNNIYITEQLKKLFNKMKPLGMEMIETDVLQVIW